MSNGAHVSAASVFVVGALVACGSFTGAPGGTATAGDAGDAGNAADSGNSSTAGDAGDAMTGAGPITYVGNVGSVHETSMSATHMHFTVGTAFAAGDVLIARFAASAYAPVQPIQPAVSDSAGNTWQLDLDDASGPIGKNQVWSSRLTTGLESGATITATFTAGVAPYSLVVDAFAGELASPHFTGDLMGKTDVGSTPNATPSDTLAIVRPAGRTQALVIGVVYDANNDPYGEDPSTLGGDMWHTLTQDYSVTAGNGLGNHAAYKIVAGNSVLTYAPTLASDQNWVETILAY